MCYRLVRRPQTPGQEGVRHELAGLGREACWNMCGAIGSAVQRR